MLLHRFTCRIKLLYSKFCIKITICCIYSNQGTVLTTILTLKQMRLKGIILLYILIIYLLRYPQRCVVIQLFYNEPSDKFALHIKIALVY